jgi:hypothetical protein
MNDEPREYDREYRRPLSGPTQIRVGFDRDKKDVTRFVVQLEYHHHNQWKPVVRYDHDKSANSRHSHDVTKEGLHIDIFRDGEKYATEYIAPAQSGAMALNRVEDHLANNLQRFINRYERWHGLTEQ